MCLIMPHRRKPSGVARNFIQRSAFYDCKTKESLNQVCAEAVLGKVAEAFPSRVIPDSAVFDEELGLASEDLQGGLVLSDPRGEGALQ